MKDTTLGTIAGGIFFVCGFLLLGTSLQAVHGSVKTEGKIVDAVSEWDFDDGKYLYAPVVEFTTPDGEAHRFTSTMYTPKELVMGDPLPVLYHAASSGEAVVDNTFDLYIFPAIFMAFGVFFLGIFTLAPFIKSFRKQPV